MWNIRDARYGADIPYIGGRVQDQRLSGRPGRSLSIGPPGQLLRLHILQAQLIEKRDAEPAIREEECREIMDRSFFLWS